ncbi:MAG: rhomboid family intramembrane serine protease, partial [Prevotella sp.]|nr:rhomboid family intramembrane serine protease [Prevotella sp.]
MFRIPTVTKNLLIINVLAFLAMKLLLPVTGVDLNDLFGLHFFMASNFQVYQLVTYMFMHGGWEHIILNMFMLWMFGAVVEQVWGGKKFLFYYIFCGVGAGVMQE